MQFLKQIIRLALKMTPYDLKRRRHDVALPAPTFENIKLALAYYLHAKQTPILVQIGACDGISGDPIHHFTRKGLMRAILVEPVEESFLKLQRAYSGVPNVTPVHTAIASKDGTMILFRVKAGAKSIDPSWGTQLASQDKGHLLKHRVDKEDIEEVGVSCLTLSSLMRKCGVTEIDILQVDTEGADAEIVKMALALPKPPECINFENVNLSPAAAIDVFEALAHHGYVWTHDEWNTLALHARLIARWESMGYTSPVCC